MWILIVINILILLNKILIKKLNTSLNKIKILYNNVPNCIIILFLKNLRILTKNTIYCIELNLILIIL